MTVQFTAFITQGSKKKVTMRLWIIASTAAKLPRPLRCRKKYKGLNSAKSWPKGEQRHSESMNASVQLLECKDDPTLNFYVLTASHCCLQVFQRKIMIISDCTVTGVWRTKDAAMQKYIRWHIYVRKHTFWPSTYWDDYNLFRPFKKTNKKTQ